MQLLLLFFFFLGIIFSMQLQLSIYWELSILCSCSNILIIRVGAAGPEAPPRQPETLKRGHWERGSCIKVSEIDLAFPTIPLTAVIVL